MTLDDFNHVKAWLSEKLTERQISLNRFVLLTGNLITNATIYRWYNDTFRPTEAKMQLVCDTLSKLPVLKKGTPPKLEHVPLGEGMAQFTLRKEGRRPHGRRRRRQ